MLNEKLHEIISFKQSNWFEKNINANTQKRKKAKNNWKKIYVNYSKILSMEEQWKMYGIASELTFL